MQIASAIARKRTTLPLKNKGILPARSNREYIIFAAVTSPAKHLHIRRFPLQFRIFGDRLNVIYFELAGYAAILTFVV